jgi:hypothetical protein
MRSPCAWALAALLLAAKLGEVVKLRRGQGTAGQRTWVEPAVAEVKP